MADFTWVLLDASGHEMRVTEAFESQDAAEAWMGDEWKALLDEGAERVSLREDGRAVYEMGLREV
jgi:hypothetical protein